MSLQFSISEINSNEGVVRYENGSEDIKITRIGVKNIGKKNQIPATILSKWKEVYEGDVTGLYYLTTRGSVVGGLQYVRSKDKKSFHFYDDQQNAELNCSWD